jgi:hypothetical protein
MMQCTSGGVLFDVISSYRRQQVFVGLHERLASQGQLTALLSSSLGTAKQETCALALYNCEDGYRALDLTKTPFELGLTVPGSTWEAHVMISADRRVCLPFFITINSQDSQIEGTASLVQGDRASSEVASRGDTSDNGKTLKETVDAELREFRGESRSSLTSADVQETVVHERLLHDKRFASSLPNVMADVQQARPMDRAVLVSGYGDAEMGDAKDSGIENVASKDKGSQHHFSSSSGINPDTTASVWPLTMEGAMDSNIIPRNDPQSQDSISVTDDEDPQSFAAGEGKCRSYICFDVW